MDRPFQPPATLRRERRGTVPLQNAAPELPERIRALLDGRLPLSEFVVWFATLSTLNPSPLDRRVERLMRSAHAGHLDPEAIYMVLARLLRRHDAQQKEQSE